MEPVGAATRHDRHRLKHAVEAARRRPANAGTTAGAGEAIRRTAPSIVRMKLWYAFCAALLIGVVLIAADPSPLSGVALAMSQSAVR